MADIIQQRRDTAARWAQYNPILLEGEVGYVTDNPNQYKIGNGRDKWNDLPLRGYNGTITQEKGNDENAVMSQAAVTKELSDLDIKFNNNQKKEIVSLSASKQIKVQYKSGVGAGQSIERLEIYMPSNVGYIRYDFVHSYSNSQCADVWRVNGATACSDDLTERFALTTNGEWEIAISLEGRPDFSGGIAHGDMVYESIAVFVDGVVTDLRDLTTIKNANKVAIVEASTLYDPNVHSTVDTREQGIVIAEHSSEHIWENGCLIINQILKWKVDDVLDNCFMAMHLPSKSCTDSYYTDKNFTPKAIHNPVQVIVQKAKRVCVYDSKGSCFTSLEIPKYPEGIAGGDYLQIQDNGGYDYNKCYFYIANGLNSPKINNGDIWESQSIYKFEIGK